MQCCRGVYHWGNAIDGLISSSIELIPIREKTRDETGQMHPRMSALIHGWGKYPWMINFHGWGATYIGLQKRAEDLAKESEQNNKIPL